jgi:AcrR family transcriptional regulator
MTESTPAPDPTTTDTSPTVETIDGRTRRRERGRAAVVDAMIDLVLEGHLPPSADQLAERSGVSVASVFRYFDGLDDLRRSATEVYLQRYDHLFEIPDIGEGPLPPRIERLVDARLRLYDIAGPMGQLVRIRSHDDTTARDNLARLRHTYADQLRHHFDTELSALSADERTDLVDVVATLTSFESWDQLRHHLGRTDPEIRRTWVRSLSRLITAR